MVQLPHGEEDDTAGGDHEHGAADIAGDELQGEVVDEAGEGKSRDVRLTEDIGEAKGQYGHADDHQGKPSLDVHARIEPLDEVGP